MRPSGTCAAEATSVAGVGCGQEHTSARAVAAAWESRESDSCALHALALAHASARYLHARTLGVAGQANPPELTATAAVVKANAVSRALVPCAAVAFCCAIFASKPPVTPA
jgi:hypothetical protein